jgi:hypothetical protein
MELKLSIKMLGEEMGHSALVEGGREATVYKKLENDALVKVKFLVDHRGPIGNVKETVGLKGSIHVADATGNDWSLLRDFDLIVARNGAGSMKSGSKGGDENDDVSLSFDVKGVDESDVTARFGKIPEPRSCPGISPKELSEKFAQGTQAKAADANAGATTNGYCCMGGCGSTNAVSL